MSEAGKPKSDLKVRTLSAIVMIAVSGWALWTGGIAFQLFVGLVGLGLYWELWGLVSKITSHAWRRALMMCAGAIYIGLACFTLVTLRSPFFGMSAALMLVGAVIATDIGAYFVGRNIGGPKIAPRISPSKTWSGLAGGMFAAGLALVGIAWLLANSDLHMGIWYHFGVGAMIAVIAQIGDFFQSWLKRRAGVKDSGNLIPGHGGLFDRADGLIAVLFVTGAIASVAWVGA